MSDRGLGQRPIDADAYARSQRQLRNLKQTLHQTNVEDLAREVLSRVAGKGGNASKGINRPSRDQIEHLAHALTAPDDRAGAAFIEEAMEAGASPEAVYLVYLAEAAQMLGEWWEEDFIPFTEVSLGTSRMYAIMRSLRREFTSQRAADKGAIFASVPGETHTLGVRMAADLFRKEGWRISLKLGLGHDALLDEISASECPILGISIAGSHAMPALSRLVVATRLVRPDILIFVGGHGVIEAHEALELMDVDAVASEMPEARAAIEAFWDRLTKG